LSRAGIDVLRALADDERMNTPLRLLCILFLAANFSRGALPIEKVEGQPLGANAARLIQALDFLGALLAEAEVKKLKAAISARDAAAIQKLLDPNVLVAVSLNPEVRVKVRRGPAKAVLRQGGFTPFLVKVLNDSTVARPLHVASPQAGAVFFRGIGENSGIEMEIL